MNYVYIIELKEMGQNMHKMVEYHLKLTSLLSLNWNGFNKFLIKIRFQLDGNEKHSRFTSVRATQTRKHFILSQYRLIVVAKQFPRFHERCLKIVGYHFGR